MNENLSNDMVDERISEVHEEPMLANNHEIFINTLDYGYVIKVGCKTFAFETSEELLKRLTNYFKNPQESEKMWNKEKKFK